MHTCVRVCVCVCMCDGRGEGGRMEKVRGKLIFAEFKLVTDNLLFI